MLTAITGEGPMRRVFAAAVVLLLSFFLKAHFLNAQAVPPAQTARQALIEMFFGQSANHLEKHLPDVTSRSLRKLGAPNGADALSQFSMMATQARDGTNLQTFDTGSTLLSADDPQGNGKVEITVERDDLVGDEDQIEVALHMTRNGKEETLPFIPRFTFAMKMESDIWRLNEVSVTVRVPLADPNFLKSVEDHQRAQNEQMAMWSMQMVSRAEKARQSAQGSFACGLSTLASFSKGGAASGVYFDPDLASGKKNGYIFAISACDASHYKLVAEPVGADSGQRAFCSDESGTIRASADGKAVTCIRNGQPTEYKASAVRATGVVGGVVEGAVGDHPGVVSPAPQSGATVGGQPKQSAQRVRISQGVSQGLILSKVQPVYPQEARNQRIEGAVLMHVVIAQTGNVISLELISGHPLLAPAAIDAVKQWKYRPYLLNGSPVEVDTRVTVNFTLGGQ